MPDCYSASGKRVNSNAVKIFMPVVCDDGDGQPVLIELEGQRDGSMTLTRDVSEVGDKNSLSMEYETLRPGMEFSVSGGVFTGNNAPAQQQMLETTWEGAKVAVQFVMSPATSTTLGDYLYAVCFITSLSFSGSLDDGDAKYDASLTVTGKPGFNDMGVFDDLL